jgi:hypothetical protein
VIAGTADADDAVQFAGTNVFRPGAELTIAATVSEPTRVAPTVQFNNLRYNSQPGRNLILLRPHNPAGQPVHLPV